MKQTFGPFTGTHLTIMFVAILAVALPGTLWAVDAYTKVAIQDPVTGVKSAIDAKRRLQVYDPVANPLPAGYVRFTVDSSVGCAPVATPPPGNALIVKSLHLNTTALPAPGSGRWIGFYVSGSSSGNPCSGNLLLAHNPATLGLTNVPIDPGIAVPVGKSLYRHQSAADTPVEVYGFGYLVSVSGCRPIHQLCDSVLCGSSQVEKWLRGPQQRC